MSIQLKDPAVETMLCPHCGAAAPIDERTCPRCHRGMSGAALMNTAPPKANPFPIGSILLILVALAAAGLGLLFLSQATIGVGLIAGGCLLAVWARLVQASAHHRDLMGKD